MTDAIQSITMGVLRIAVYAGAAAIAMLGASLHDVGHAGRIVLALAGLIVGLGAVVSLYRFTGRVQARQLASERFVAALGIGALSAAVVAINLDRLGEAEAEGPGSEQAAVPAPPTRDVAAAPVAFPGPPGNPPAGVRTKTNGPPRPSEAPGPQMPPELAREVDAKLVSADRLAKEGKLQEAEPLLIEVLETMDAHAPRDLPQRGQVVGTLARLRFAAGQKWDGLDAIDQHITRLESSDTTEPLVIASFHELAGTLLGNADAFSESIERFRKVLALQTRIEAAPAALASTHAKLAVSLAKLNEMGAARQELAQAKALLEEQEPRDQEVIRGLEQIAEQYGL